MGHLKMQALLSLLTVLAITLSAATASKGNAIVACYWEAWSGSRDGLGKYTIDNIPVELCTHFVYSFVGLSNVTNEIKVLDPKVDVEEGGFSKFTALRKHHRKVKLIVSVGGWNEGGAQYSKMVSDKSSRTVFIQSVVDFLIKYCFDGINLDWEYPGSKDRDGVPADKANFLALTQELKAAFNKAGKNWELTAAVPLTASALSDGYDVPGLCTTLDSIYVMSYDLRGNWDGFVDVNAPLYSRPDDLPDYKQNNVNDGLALWESLGCPANKLIVGIPFYGKSFTLPEGSTDYSLGAPANTTAGGGNPGRYTGEAGTLAYYEICSVVDADGSSWTKKWSEYGNCPYAYSGDQWVGYEDEKSVEIKMKWLIEKGYGGAMTWAIDLDDFQGLCGRKNPLLNLLHKYMKSYTPPRGIRGHAANENRIN